jgi:2,5-dihydroxypyridine 5,6-dioxygenase
LQSLDNVLENSFAAIWTASLGLDTASGGSALVVSDASADPRVVHAALAGAARLGHQASHFVHNPRSTVPMRTFGSFPSSAFEPAAIKPYPVLNAAVAAADAVILLSSELALLFNPEFRTALRASRVAFLPYLDRELALRLLPSSADEVAEVAQLTIEAARRLEGAHEIRLTSKAGTDLRLCIGQYAGNCSAGSFSLAKGFGGLEVLPAGQVAIVPDDGSIHGRLVVEGSVNYPRFERVNGRIELEIESSVVQSIGGGNQAAQFARALDAIADRGNPRHVTEFGLGTNRKCKFLGVYGPTEDTHRIGTVSMALGADTHLGGRNSAGCHIDMALEETRVFVDGTEFLSPEYGFLFEGNA